MTTKKHNSKPVIRCNPAIYQKHLPPISFALTGTNVQLLNNYNLRLQIPFIDNVATIYSQFDLIVCIDDEEYVSKVRLNSGFYTPEMFVLLYGYSSLDIEKSVISTEDKFAELLINKNFQFLVDFHVQTNTVELKEAEAEISILDDELEHLLQQYPDLTGESSIIVFENKIPLNFNFNIIKISRINEYEPAINEVTVRLFTI